MTALLPYVYACLAALMIALLAWRALVMKKAPRQARLDAIAWASSVLASPDGYAILDTETTGVGEDDEIIQIAIVDPSGRELVNTLVRPTRERSIPAKATAVHGIRRAHLRDAPSWPDVSPEVEEALCGRRVVAYNAAFDGRLMQQTHRINGGLAAPSEWACAMLAYAAFVGEPDVRKPGEYKWQKLAGGDHTAIGDCRATLALIRLMAAASTERS
ncbi:MAG: 3'-5' exonuclease [Sandaracinaceae bacterium]|nr:3'-5' exonuclease [Sandaracinaceae bacterium]